jgi:ribosomal protein L40E
MSMLDDLKSSFFKFRQRKYALYVGLLVTLAICSLLILFVNYFLCFGFLLIALAGYYIPYFFGMKSKKKLAVWGIVLILVMSLPYSLALMQGDKAAAADTIGGADGKLSDGKVIALDQGSGSYQYSVLAPNGTYSQMNVQVFDGWTGEEVLNETMGSQAAPGGTLYTYNATTLTGTSEYIFYFLASDGHNWTASDRGIGPIRASDSEIFVHWLPLVIVAMLIEVGMLFYLLLALNWMTERSKKRMADLQKTMPKKEEGKVGKDEKFVCSECGAEVPMDATKCPQCGENFEEESKQEPQEPKQKDKSKDEYFCTECGAKVNEDSKSCWNCGKQFEN